MSYMFSVVVCAFVWVNIILSSQASGQSNLSAEEVKIHTQLLNSHASSIVGKVNIALLGLSEVITRVELSEKEAHDLLSSMSNELDGVRAIIFIAQDGTLKYDSFSYPVPQVNLSSREYFTHAIAIERGRLAIGKPIKGKTSGIPFLPIAKSVWKNNQLVGVLSAVITPSTLTVTEEATNCLHCASLLTTLTGEVISQYPHGIELHKEFIEKLNAKNRIVTGSEIITIGLLKARAHWIRNKKFPFISIFLEFIQN